MTDGRRIKEIYTYNTAMGFVMYALCDDGTLWSRSPFSAPPGDRWDMVPPIPGSVADLMEKAKEIEVAAADLFASV